MAGLYAPHRRFANVLADVCAGIGGDVGCYSFIAVNFHHILLASLPAHSLALRPAHSRCHQFVTRIPKASVRAVWVVSLALRTFGVPRQKVRSFVLGSAMD